MGTNSREKFGAVAESERMFDAHRFPDVLLQGPVGWAGGNSADRWRPPEGEVPVACDYFGGVFEYIKRMLMEEDDLEHRPCMFQDCSALQAAEKYFHDALSDKDSAPLCGTDGRSFLNKEDLGFGMSASSLGQWSLVDQQVCGGILDSSCLGHFQGHSVDGGQVFQGRGVGKNGSFLVQIHDSIDFYDEQVMENKSGSKSSQPDDSGTGNKQIRAYENGGDPERQRSKILASYEHEEEDQECVRVGKYDKALLCHQMNPRFYDRSPVLTRYEETSEDEVDTKFNKQPEVKRGRPKGSSKKQPPRKPASVKEVVDLRTLLTKCALAVSSFNIAAARELLMQIRQHSSPYGDANERLTYCFANALEARMASTGSMMYTASASRRIPAAELLRSYQAYVTACPFKRMSNVFANKTIAGYTKDADKIHIIDFGILYGFQWPCIIQGISLRPGGPPRLKITGIDFPQPGFRPAEQVEQTGRRLMSYCKRFNVPFEYNAIAKRWDEISLEDLQIQRDEMVVANCLYRLRHVPDECTGLNSPRNDILRLIRMINPDLFVHGVVNGTYNTSFFTSRFKEALFHYSSHFDMLEATIPREDQDRLLYEREVFGREIMNVIACEGAERIERPETYKQWTVRNQRAGFKQIPLNQEIVKEIKIKVRKGYHNDFLLEEDCEWMLQGWKGRVLHALSCWKPSTDALVN